MAAATPEIALTAKLKAGATGAGSDVFPQLNTQEPYFPLIVVTRLGADGGSRLNGSARALKSYTVRVDCYAETQLEAATLAKQVRDLLTPDGSPWNDATNGVQGCFFTDSVEEVTEDGIRVSQETYTVWHTPT